MEEQVETRKRSSGRRKFATIAEAKACIERNGGIVSPPTVTHPHPGLKVLSAIDFLCNFHKYVWTRHAER